MVHSGDKLLTTDEINAEVDKMLLGDLISRQAAIDAMQKLIIADDEESLILMEYNQAVTDCVDKVMELPPVEQCEEDYPDCRECEHYDHEKHHCPRFCAVIRDALAEVEQKQKIGHWEWDNDFQCRRCSECHLSKDSKYFNYCSNCGAKMCGGDNE